MCSLRISDVVYHTTHQCLLLEESVLYTLPTNPAFSPALGSNLRTSEAAYKVLCMITSNSVSV